MSQDKLTTLRNTTEHVLTMAMEILYGSKIKKAMGPAIDDGFYFDFETPKNFKISKDDFPKIESQMHKLISLNLPVTVEKVSKPEALKIFKNNLYKHHWIDKALETDKQIRIVTIGQKGTDYYFPDVCKDEHLKSTGEIKAFKLLSVAGAYWLGNEKNQMLTRIYGTAFNSPKELRVYLSNIEEAKKRDHRLIGQNLKLFMFDNEVGQGLPLYLPNGAMLRHLLIDFALTTYLNKGYQLVSSPHIGSEKLWLKSGHIGFYDDSMYGALEVEGEKYRLKPMNCPFHVKMYTSEKRSYRELPIRWTEMGTVYRYEKSGELHGLVRPRGFTQDDAHIICTPEQLESEIKNALNLIEYIYSTLGMKKLIYKLSVRDPKQPKKYVGSNQDWQKAESSLKKILIELGHKDYELDIGGAAFYAPKIDIDAVDSMNRRWQLSTIQVDFNLPTRFKMTYINQKGQEQTPFMIHRALLGSIERFLGVYIEHTAGVFPTWLSPVQVSVIPISDKNMAYATKVTLKLKEAQIRVELDDSNSTLNAKIRNAQNQKIPYMLILGDKEEKNETVSERGRSGKNYGELSLNKFIQELKLEIEKKVINW